MVLAFNMKYCIHFSIAAAASTMIFIRNIKSVSIDLLLYNEILRAARLAGSLGLLLLLLLCRYIEHGMYTNVETRQKATCVVVI